jgi:hypothetical protein
MPWGFTLYHLPHGIIEVFFCPFLFFFFVAQMKKKTPYKRKFGQGMALLSPPPHHCPHVGYLGQSVLGLV